MAVLGLATVTGNGAVLLALSKARRAPSHYPLASLATADLLVGLFVLPIAAARELFVFHVNSAICSCWSTLDVLCCTASILSLCALGWERYSGITAPLARAKRTRHAKIFAALVWPVSLAVALPTVFVPSPKHYILEDVPKACDVNTNVGYVVFSTMFSFYLPGLVLVVLYARILSALATPPAIRAHRGAPLHNTHTQVQNASPAPDNTSNSHPTTSSPGRFLKDKIQKAKILLSPMGRHLHLPGAGASSVKPVTPVKNFTSPAYLLTRQRRATRTIVMLMTLFLVCWTPFFVMLPIDAFCECVSDVAWQWCTWLGYVNSALNPVVYAAASPSVRQALQKTLTSTSSTKTTDIPLTPNVRIIP